MAQRTLQSLQGLIPNLKDNIVTSFVETPSETETRTGNSSGAAFGWALTPGQYGEERLSQVTPIKDLYLAGHWAAPGAGLPDVIRSAKSVVKLIQG
jgi:prolycopene isomerase